MPSKDLYDVGVYPLSVDTTFLTDRWGEPVELDDPEYRERHAAAGLTKGEIEEITKPLEEAFNTESCFLVHRPGLMKPRETALFVEFEFAEQYQPETPLSAESSKEDVAAWRDCLSFHAPALVHVARGMEENGALPSGQGTLFFDTSAAYNGSIVALLPTEISEDAFWSVHDLLYHNGLAFPHSRHAQIAALAEMRWRFDPALTPQDALPGACLSFNVAG